jgi:hypothetical protein
MNKSNSYSCHCGHQFCYECNTRCKTCECPIFLEHRLLATAIDQVQRQSPAAAVPGVNVEVRIAEARRTILEQHDCVHEWTREDGPGIYDEFGEEYRWFTVVCDDCQRVHCASCRYNE